MKTKRQVLPKVEPSPIEETFGDSTARQYEKKLLKMPPAKRTLTQHLNALQDSLNEGAKGFRPGKGKTTSRPVGGTWRPA